MTYLGKEGECSLQACSRILGRSFGMPFHPLDPDSGPRCTWRTPIAERMPSMFRHCN